MGEKIKELRESKGISQYRLAELTGINRSTINRYENGSIQKISFDNLLKICEALEIDIKEISKRQRSKRLGYILLKVFFWRNPQRILIYE